MTDSILGRPSAAGSHPLLLDCKVYQLPKQRPDKVLKRIWQNLDAAVREGDEKAWHIQNNMRVVAAGGDGTYSWLLQAIA